VASKQTGGECLDLDANTRRAAKGREVVPKRLQITSERRQLNLRADGFHSHVGCP
jgi:hypothetical protein